ncbi:class I SAM-dependent methyltransferase [Spirabiliibacterium falconis]|uniref:class I SAM-dependent methyltransferase n=1 Tax=Spirabiliibacterium falconis TaxID=572023 RepID=UPI001AAD4FB6|nr:methyltransferase domain-containing protein [Spirabiliibacterium falconis]MBE2894311.1 class I SAM-dependent methyltransferase [Spirabiliibacterium falconis]
MANAMRWDWYAVFYDHIISLVAHQRKQVFAALDFSECRKFWLPGCGNGQDLAFLPAQSAVYASDFSHTMLLKCQQRQQKLAQQGHNLDLHIEQVNVLHSRLPDQSMDCVLLHLILAVVDDETALLQEAVRVLKEGGILSIWDKAVLMGENIGVLRRWLNKLTAVLGTRITLQIDNLLIAQPLAIITQQTFFGGQMQHICLRKVTNKD